MEKLILIDGSSIIFRAFYALPKFSTSNNIPTSAVYGFLRMLLRILKDESPNYVSVAFDKKAPTFRHVEFKEYKAQRPKMPDELSQQFDIVKEVLEAFEIKYFEIDGFEADDIIATQVEQFKHNKNLLIYILSSDFDLSQLIDDNVILLVTRKGVTQIEVFDKEKFLKDFGFEPKHMVDYKALIGDTSDNIDGIKGIGKVTAEKLIKEFGSVENIISNKEIKEKFKLVGFEEKILRNKSLCTLINNVPLEFNLDDLKVSDFRNLKVKNVLSKYEFNSIIKEFKLDNLTLDNSVNLFKTDTTKEYTNKERKEVTNNKAVIEIVYNEKVIENVLLLYNDQFLSFDFSTNLFLKPNEIELLKKIISDGKIAKYTNSLKLLYKLADYLEVEVKNVPLDYELALYVLDPDLNDFSVKNFNKFLKDVGTFSNKLDEMKFILEHANEIIEILKKEGLFEVYNNIELPLLKVLFLMEKKGIKIDTNWFTKLDLEINEEINRVEQEIFKLANISFNILSPKQLSSVLFDVLGIVPPKDFKGSTGISILSEIADTHPIIPLILNYRHLVKLRNTYIKPIPSLVSKENKRLHTIFHEIGTATGRLRSTNPNLQNLPIKDTWGIKIQKGFIADDGFSLVSCDYSQIELRILAHLSEDERLIDAFLNGEDIHRVTAMEIFSLRKEEVTKEKRDFAKTINFGIIYGMSPYGLAKQTKMSREEAKDYIERYFKKYPKVLEYIEKSVELARQNGFVRTISGRRRFVKDIDEANKNIRESARRIAINSPIQGSAADIIKLAMLKINEVLGEDINILLQIHDELIFEVKDEKIDMYIPKIKEIMENIVSLKVPLVVDVAYGKTLGDVRNV